MLMQTQANTIQSLHDNYNGLESDLCDVPEEVHEGDKLFTNSRWIIREYIGDIENLLTPKQELEHKIMNAIKISIEHEFAVLCNCWKLMAQFNEFKLSVEHSHAGGG